MRSIAHGGWSGWKFWRRDAFWWREPKSQNNPSRRTEPRRSGSLFWLTIRRPLLRCEPHWVLAVCACGCLCCGRAGGARNLLFLSEQLCPLPKAKVLYAWDISNDLCHLDFDCISHDVLLFYLFFGFFLGQRVSETAGL